MNPASQGAAEAVALLSRAAAEDVDGAWELADEIARGDAVREATFSLACIAAGLAGAVAHFRGVAIGVVLDDAASVASETINDIETEEDNPCPE